ncbi:MAG: hypothetical protein H7330_11715, partial [Hymenobacteraceae bacterium]|nr:hypothetical protein [Hymenobacteraceae bacterium]
MTDLNVVFDEDYFSDKNITFRRLQKFVGEVLARMLADSLGGKLTAVRAEVDDHATDLFGDMKAVDQATGERRGNAKGMWAALRGLNTLLDADDELIWLKAKQNPLLGTAFFPTGSRTEYGRATLLTADVLFARVVKAATDHAAALGPEFDASKYTALQ